MGSAGRNPGPRSCVLNWVHHLPQCLHTHEFNFDPVFLSGGWEERRKRRHSTAPPVGLLVGSGLHAVLVLPGGSVDSTQDLTPGEACALLMRCLLTRLFIEYRRDGAEHVLEQTPCSGLGPGAQAHELCALPAGPSQQAFLQHLSCETGVVSALVGTWQRPRAAVQQQPGLTLCRVG